MKNKQSAIDLRLNTEPGVLVDFKLIEIIAARNSLISLKSIKLNLIADIEKAESKDALVNIVKEFDEMLYVDGQLAQFSKLVVEAEEAAKEIDYTNLIS